MKCKLCQVSVDFLPAHLTQVHNLSIDQISDQVGSKIMSARLERALYENAPDRRHPIQTDLKVKIGPAEFIVNTDIPSSVCLPLPSHYLLPTEGPLGRSVTLALARISTMQKTGGSVMIYGPAGCGKDAIFHYLCATTHTPSLVFSFAQADVSKWLFSREINERGSFWVEGALTRALRDGYQVKDKNGAVIRTVPYAILFSDLDRATPEQAEILRLMLDSIEPRFLSPQGDTIPVYKGTLFFATANTAGGGDHTGRFVSAQVIDATIMDRMAAVYQFHPIQWDNEKVILERAYPEFFRSHQEYIKNLGVAFNLIHKAIDGDEIFTDFSHRGIVRIIEQAQALYTCGIAENVFIDSFEVFLASLSSQAERMAIRRILDPRIPGFLPKKKADTQKTTMS